MLYFSTIFARNASSILGHLSRLPAELAAHPLLFTLSANTPVSSLSPLVSALSSFSSSGNVGCLSGAAHSGVPISCSLAFFRKDEATPFRSDIPGRPETQVGRWHAMRKKGADEGGLGSDVALEGNMDWEKLWSRGLEGDALPPALRKLNRKDDVHTIISLTDNAPQGFNQALSSFHNANKLGLFASSTPFVTGRPFTLIHDDAVYSSGAVGVALSASPRPALQTSFIGLRAMSAPLMVTQSEGNLINELDSANPTSLLISAIEKSALSGEAAKDDEFYLGVLRNGKLWQVHHIMSGGPSRGTMSLDTETAPVEGTLVQLFHRPRTGAVSAAPPSAAKHTLTFTASIQPDAAPPPAVESADSEVTVLDDAFVAASENGFMVSREAETTWTCTAPDAQARLAW
ncbi:hypothetical protein BC834DRAFT_924224 [Gloeopeniophorella convolvens]|nr:hypothetical protein BC834DRAFT_924224 [Gloeopeniophorella convolvens]